MYRSHGKLQRLNGGYAWIGAMLVYAICRVDLRVFFFFLNSQHTYIQSHPGGMLKYLPSSHYSFQGQYNPACIIRNADHELFCRE